MSNLYTYVMQHDSGLAPNPFWGACTLAVCTPNHQGSKVVPGDWIAGFQNKAHGYKLIHAMEIEERLDMDAYFRDPRFEAKRPNLRGTWQQQCGDNFYSRSSSGEWVQHANQYHCSAGDLIKDTKHPWVFVARRFWYFGGAGPSVPNDLRSLAGGRGARVNHPPGSVEQFKAWVSGAFPEGISARPRDAKLRGCAPTTKAAPRISNRSC